MNSNLKSQKSKIMRIIDVNTNRAMEGLRVVEEVCRFVLEDKKSAKEIKEMRSQLKRASDIFSLKLSSRDSENDLGRKMYTDSEGKRNSLSQIFLSNIKRAQEALRCLEEFSKMIGPKYGKRFKGLRFSCYTLEKELAPKIKKLDLLDFDLYVVSDPMVDHLKAARGVVRGAGRIFQLRDKSISKKEYLKLAKKIRRITQKAGVTFIVNDYPDIARKIGADGVHLGQEDLKLMPIKKARKMIGDDKLIGISTHSLGQALRASRSGCDYISVGPIFKTPSKPLGKPVGTGLLKKIAGKVSLPVVAIGGINRENIAQITDLGIKRVAVIREALGAKKIPERVKLLRRSFG